MKRNLFSAIFSKKIKILFFIIFLFFVSIGNIKKSEASICADWSTLNQECRYTITRNNINSASSTKYLSDSLAKTEKEAEEYRTELENRLNEALGSDPDGAIEDVEYAKKAILAITTENQSRFNSARDLLVDNKNGESGIYKFLFSGSADENMYRIDQGLETLVKLIRLETLSTKLTDLKNYLDKKENSGNELEKNSVSPKLKQFLMSEVLRINSNIVSTTGNTNIHQVKFKSTNNGTEITIYLNPQNGWDIVQAWTEEKPEIIYTIPNDLLKLGDITDPTSETTPTSAEPSCNTGDDFWKTFTTPGCSMVAYLVNLTLQGLNSFFGVVLELSGKLFDWAMGFSIYNFSDLVSNSGAYEVWRTVILALVTSLLLPVVFYYIIRMLIDNDTAKIQKILPRILFTALFVYFSFSIVGFLIDQANVFSIYIYRSLHSPDQSIASSMERLIIGDPSLKSQEIINTGTWSSVPAFLIQLLITGVSIIIFFQAAILIFVRGITLILCMIFSPVMLLPAGINSYIDKYRDMVIKYFTNATIMAPIFLFLILIAMKVGSAGSNLITGTDALTTISGTGSVSGQLVGAAISGVISIIILQLAITTAKNLSGDIGTKVSGKISGVVGNMAFGGASKVMKTGAQTLANSKRFNGWIEKGGARGKLAYNLLKSTQNSTFDPRNSKTFQTATGGTFGRGNNMSTADTVNKRYRNEKGYYDMLNPEAKERRLGVLRGRGPISTAVANRLEKNTELSMKEKIQSDKKFNNKFDNANKEKDEKKRLDKINKSIDEHFKENGKGEKYFTEAMKKKENEEIKKKLEEANKNPDEEKRKKEILKVVSEFEEKDNKKQNTNNLAQNQNTGGQANTSQAGTENATQAQGGNSTQSNTQGIKPQTNANLTPLRDRLAERQNRTGKTIGEEKSQSQLRRTLDLGKEAKDREEENKRYMADLGKRQEAADKLRDEREKAAVQKSVARQARKLQGEGVSKEDLPKTFSQAMTANNFRQMMRDSNLNSVTITKDTDPIKSSPITNNTTNNINITNSNTNSGVNVITPEANNKPNIVREIGGNSEQNQSLKELREMAHDLKINSIPVGNINLGTKLKTEPEKAERRVNVNSTRKDNLDGNNYINR